MKRLLLGALLGTGLAHAAAPIVTPEVHHAFAAVSVGKLQVIETRGELALVEGEKGEVVLVHLNDRLGLEAVRVERIARGCVMMSGDGGQFSLCAEAPATPRS